MISASSLREIEKGSRYRGVSVHHSGKWQAQIQVNYRTKYLGTFPSEVLAARAYDAAAREHHGDRARCNFPDPPLSAPARVTDRIALLAMMAAVLDGADSVSNISYEPDPATQARRASELLKAVERHEAQAEFDRALVLAGMKEVRPRAIV